MYRMLLSYTLCLFAMIVMATRALAVAPPAVSLPAPDQLLSLMAATIARLENLRRDTHDPAEAKRLHRLVKRLRKTAMTSRAFS